MNFWRHSFSDNDAFRRQLKKMKFSENCVFSLMRRRNISSQMGFLRSPKQMHQLLSWILLCQLSLSIRILAKLAFSENYMLMSNVNPTIKSFKSWFLAPISNVDLEYAKPSSLRTPNLFRRYILCRAIKADLFSNAASILGMRCSVESKKVKPSFSDWIWERTTFWESNSVFDIARWTFTCFRVKYLGSTRPFIENLVD